MKIYIIFGLLVLAIILVGCQSAPTGEVVGQPQQQIADNAQIVELGLDRNGYTPQNIVVEVGRPVTFVKGSTLGGCATHLVQPELGIDANFVRNAQYTFTPEKKGEYVLSCSMGMYKGKLTVV